MKPKSIILLCLIFCFRLNCLAQSHAELLSQIDDLVSKKEAFRKERFKDIEELNQQKLPPQRLRVLTSSSSAYMRNCTITIRTIRQILPCTISICYQPSPKSKTMMRSSQAYS